MTYPYTHPEAAGPAITAASLQQALDEGRAARALVVPGGERPTNPYAGQSMTLDFAWRRGYDGKDQARRDLLEKDLAILQDNGLATPLPDDEPEEQPITSGALSPELAADLAATFDVSRMPSALKTYWVRGPGAAKIRWGQPGDFDRCRKAINKEIVEDGRPPLSDRIISGLCSNLHVEATGGRPGTE